MEPYLNQPRKESTAFHQHAQIAAALEGCLQTCQLLASVVEANSPIWDEKAPLLRDHQRQLIEWARTTKAANGTLDHALRKNSDLRNEVVDHLENFNSELQRGGFSLTYFVELNLIETHGR